MSLYGAMFSGVSGLAAQSQAMGVISDNISNMNTVGYKSSTSRFATLVTTQATATRYSPGGVTAYPNALIDRQGLLQSSASATDIGISGQGFFVVNTLSQPTATDGTWLFTRSGSFTTDKDGYLRNAAGYYLMSWPVDSAGAIPSNRSDLNVLQAVNVKGLTGTAAATTTVSIAANLQASQAVSTQEATYNAAVSATNMASGNVTPDFERSLQIYDSKGGTRTLTIGFLKDNVANQWHAEIYVEPSTDTTATDGQISSGIVAFNTDGTLNLGSTTLSTSLSITWASALGLANSSLTLSLGTDGQADGMTQYDSNSLLISTDVNGKLFGSLSGVSFDQEGWVTALFDNGSQTRIFKTPIALFQNPNGLGNRSGNAWIETDQSGDFNLLEAGTGGAGAVAASSLEASTVDLAEELSNMIISQRAYSASGKIITTADDMLEELIRLKR